MDLSIIIVSYNTKDLLRRCLRTCFGSATNFRFEVFVSDNGSTDGSVELIKQEFPQVKLVENNANLGFSKGNNVALKQAQGRYSLLLNSDTEVNSDTFDLSIKYMDQNPAVGALSCKILLPDGSLDKSARRRFPNPTNSFFRLFGLRKFSDYNITAGIDEEVEIDSGVGAYLMVRKEAIAQVGYLDEEFFMYGEDLDWCWRIKEAGFKIMYYPKASILHLKSASSKSLPFTVIKWAHQAMKIFYRKHYAQKNNWLFNQLVYLGINLRMLLVLAMNLFRNKKSVH
ncbi:MAG: glycosyltransferase family 2 protein [Candidatus Doudnabacteria bacterium]|nr:glycosyltransferase family 2 protein [Candidatus Doudnabacteria bacterium]